MFAKDFNDILHAFRQYIAIALMSLGWRNPYYYASLTFLVFLLPRSLARNAEAMGARFGLSGREVEVLTLFSMGHTQKQVAEELFISPSTAHAHIRHIYTKTGMHSRQDILNYFKKMNER